MAFPFPTKSPVAAETPEAKASPQPQGNFWHEFLRVQSDKILLLCLIVFLFHIHADEKFIAATIGGLIVLIQGQRFRF